ncbi:putative maltokinase [Prosthecobacter dejongeii]|uniref:Maltokinase n=1 Tax=Prosthecobacter dejongeii TaxID=48465 RepID=A0A7W7YGI8_9BACT|nr:trehalose synthase-fused probable maltokinase [Prosthecobacter dejongeii]
MLQTPDQEPLDTLGTSPPCWSPALTQKLAQDILPRYLSQCRWFGGKARALQKVEIIQDTLFPGTSVHILGVEITFQEGPPEHYLMPLCVRSPGEPREETTSSPHRLLGQWSDGTRLEDALHTPEFQAALFRGLIGHTPLAAPLSLTLESPVQAPTADLTLAALQARVLSGEQSNTSLSYADRWLIKFFRKFEFGIHPEVELTQHLTRHHFQVPPFLSALNLQAQGQSGVAAMLTHYTPHENDGWTFTLKAVRQVLDQVRQTRQTHSAEREAAVIGRSSYPSRAAQLGQLTARMHIALAADSLHADFKPQPFTHHDGQILSQDMQAKATRVLQELHQQYHQLPESAQALAREILDGQDHLLHAYEKLQQADIQCSRIRVHGDFHLGQTLNTGQDFVIIDFEGEPRLPLHERRLHRPALRDVAGMVRSFEYAASAALHEAPAEEHPLLAPWAQAWADTTVQAYLHAYFSTAHGQSFLPQTPASTQLLLDLHILDKALYEIGYELSYRPHLVPIPLRAVARLLKTI